MSFYNNSKPLTHKQAEYIGLILHSLSVPNIVDQEAGIYVIRTMQQHSAHLHFAEQSWKVYDGHSNAGSEFHKINGPIEDMKIVQRLLEEMELPFSFTQTDRMGSFTMLRSQLPDLKAEIDNLMEQTQRVAFLFT